MDDRVILLLYLSVRRSNGLSSESWRLIHYADGDEEFYDSKADRYEWSNLATKPEHSARIAELRDLGPTNIAAKQAPSVGSLPKLKWIVAGIETAPPSNPDGGPFDVFFNNGGEKPVKLYWMDRQAAPQPYGTIAGEKQKRQETRPGAVWLITDQSDRPLGHFAAGDRSARAEIPPGL